MIQASNLIMFADFVGSIELLDKPCDTHLSFWTFFNRFFCYYGCFLENLVLLSFVPNELWLVLTFAVLGLICIFFFCIEVVSKITLI